LVYLVAMQSTKAQRNCAYPKQVGAVDQSNGSQQQSGEEEQKRTNQERMDKTSEWHGKN
jgi:hypothetical protein